MDFTKRSFHFAIFSIILMILFLVLSATNRNGSTSLDSLVGYMITLFFATVVIGFVFALLSLQDKRTTKKYIGLVINIGLMILLTINVLQNLSTITEAFS